MLRLVSASLPLATATALSVRFQSSSALPAMNQNRRSQNRRNFISTNSLPKFEIHDVRDDPEHGSMTRVSVDGKQLLVSQFPQLGPRKADPNDTTPQFDRDRRISMRFRHIDLAGFVSVVENRISSHHVKNNAFDMAFEKTTNGYVLKGQVHRSNSQANEEWAVRFENQFAVTMEHFLESALTESFGFAQHQRALVRGDSPPTDSPQNNQDRNRNQNRNQSRRRNNNSNAENQES
ncbi:mitochondrial RNA binding protein 1 [Leishmania major strain Friedlin]|uniref:Mitochondrial RNA binding protein 1 n=1 Tax=Leishmania major TaxID=5664 RepID=E9AD89_LEIMA|nr:mitochondrial RNA binding protein 1 [Leishmania major strain Friedlin]CAG9576714.1 guide_RNA-binding_protein_of_21_kDa/gBP21 [Leishmania major strain Friedlin]CBZ12174.1 mitochondrial RNA binding protein 1 [Leishmania major strain Friedlin]|eukprot:XP_003721918.1 mitochondrial RNA binding protein 1 [Leishmania major strain Friedlin]